MVKWIGGLCILLAGFVGGRLIGFQYTQRARELQEFANSLHILETEIGYGQTLLPLAAARLAEISPQPHKGFFQIFQQHLQSFEGWTADQAWQKVITETAGNFCMRPEDWEVLQQYGRALGSSNDQDQVRHLKLAEKRLETLESKAREEAEKMSRLWNYVGILTSIMVVIILL
jgi:stage III sporulation protein AB